MTILADSGSTKTSWYAAPHGLVADTSGINPVRDDAPTLRAAVLEARRALDAGLARAGVTSFNSGAGVRAVHFYGAGCLPQFTEPLRAALCEAFPGAQVSVESDLLGAARALCGRSRGVACILGTGSNSCLYDGRRIVANTPALGWILGDEGSGAVLGRVLVGDVLKGVLPATLRDAFFRRFGLSQADVVDAVYRRPQPNRFLASLVPFLADHRAEAPVRSLLMAQFRAFLVRNVAAYDCRHLPVHFVGGVAYQFEDELREAARAENFSVGLVLRNPVLRLAEFHGCGS